MVRGAGLEPASLAAKDPKSFAFANFASRADGRGDPPPVTSLLYSAGSGNSSGRRGIPAEK